MRYIIYGAGAIGGSIGARLYQCGLDVTLIARGEHFSAISEKGLRYRNPDQDVTLPIPVVDHPGAFEFQDDDVVFLTMKSQHTVGALTDLSAVTNPQTRVICCQNGVANEREALRRFTNVYCMVVMLPATHLVAGEVLHNSTTPGGVLDCGKYPEGVDETIGAVAKDLSEAGYLAQTDPQAMRWKYAKLLGNLGNSANALCDARPSDILKQARDEALACYAAAGIDCATSEETKSRYQGIRSGPITGIDRGGGSSWQSLQRGTGDIEADYLNGEICLLGRLHGVPTPVNRTLQVLANRAVKLGLKPGAMTPEDIQNAIAK